MPSRIGEFCYLKPKRFFDPTGDLDPSVELDFILQELSGEPQLTPPLFEWRDIAQARCVGEEIVLSGAGQAHKADIRFVPGKDLAGKYSISAGAGHTPTETGDVAIARVLKSEITSMPWTHIATHPFKYLVWTFRPGVSFGDKIWLIGLSALPERYLGENPET